MQQDDVTEQAVYFKSFMNSLIGRPLATGFFSRGSYESADDAQEAWQHARAECVDLERALEVLNYGFKSKVLSTVGSFAQWQERLKDRQDLELTAMGVKLEYEDRDAATAKLLVAGQSPSAIEYYSYLKRKDIRRKFRDQALRAIVSTPWLKAYLDDLRTLDSIPDASARLKATMQLWRKHSDQPNEDI